MDSAGGSSNTYPLESDLSGEKRYPAFEQLGPDLLPSISQSAEQAKKSRQFVSP